MQTFRGGVVCQDVDATVEEFLWNNRGLPDAAIRAHIDSCSRCRTLYGPLPMEFRIKPGLEDRIAARLANHLKKVRPLPSHRSVAIRFFLLLLLMVLLAASLSGREGLANMTGAQTAGMLTTFGACALLFSVALSQQIAPGSLPSLRPGVVIAVFAGGFLAGALTLFPAGDPHLWSHMGSQCTRSGLLIAVPAALLIAALVVRGFALSLPMVGATAGGAAGLVAAAVLQIQCNQHTFLHIGVWHGVVVAVTTLAGLIAGFALACLRSRRIAAGLDPSRQDVP